MEWMDRSPPAGGQQCKEANKWASFRAATKETPPQAILLPHSQSGINALRLCSQVLSATKLRTFHLLRIWTETEGTAATPFFSSFFFREIQSNSVARVRKLRMTRQEKPFPLCPTKVELPRGNEEGRKEGKRGDWPPPLIPRAVASSSSVARGNGDQRKKRGEKGPIHPLQSGAPGKHSGGGGGPRRRKRRPLVFLRLRFLIVVLFPPRKLRTLCTLWKGVGGNRADGTFSCPGYFFDIFLRSDLTWLALKGEVQQHLVKRYNPVNKLFPFQF